MLHSTSCFDLDPFFQMAKRRRRKKKVPVISVRSFVPGIRPLATQRSVKRKTSKRKWKRTKPYCKHCIAKNKRTGLPCANRTCPDSKKYCRVHTKKSSRGTFSFKNKRAQILASLRASDLKERRRIWAQRDDAGVNNV
jgi:hypothetical protein